MGIDFTRCNASWSYSGFNRFRESLAKEIGFNLNDFKGFGGKRGWEEMDSGLKPLLNHSDCDGYLTKRECELIVPAMKEIIKGWDDDYDRQQAESLIGGMEDVIRNGGRLEFI